MLRRIFVYLMGAAILVIAALIIGAIPISAGPENGDTNQQSIRVYVLSNGFHSDIALPRSAGQTMAKLSLNEGDYPVAIEEVQYWAIGWGSKTAFTSLLAVSDLTIGIAAKALAFDETVMHVTPLGALSPRQGVYALDLRPTEYQQLIANISEWFNSRSPMKVTQGFGDRFYQANGQFSPWMTCNSWTGQRLREIGVSVGMWAPLSQSLEFGLGRVASGS